MARIEEGGGEVREGLWNLSRIKEILTSLTRIKVPLQVLSVLLVAVAVFSVYRAIEPKVTLPGRAPLAVAPDHLPKGDSSPEFSAPSKGDKQGGRTEHPGPSQKEAPRDAEKPGPRADGPVGGTTGQSPSPAELQITERMKDEMRRAVLGPEPQKATETAKARLPGPPATAPAKEEQARSQPKAEAAKGMAAPVPAFPSASNGAARPAALGVTLRVNKDLVEAAKEVEGLLREFGASPTTGSKDGATLVSAEVNRQKAAEIVKRLASVGRMEHIGQLADEGTDRPVSLRIHIFQREP